MKYTMPQLDIVCHQIKLPRVGYIWLSPWPQRFQRPSQTLQAIAKAISYPPQPDGKALLLETKLTYAIEYRDI